MNAKNRSALGAVGDTLRLAVALAVVLGLGVAWLSSRGPDSSLVTQRFCADQKAGKTGLAGPLFLLAGADQHSLRDLADKLRSKRPALANAASPLVANPAAGAPANSTPANNTSANSAAANAPTPAASKLVETCP